MFIIMPDPIFNNLLMKLRTDNNSVINIIIIIINFVLHFQAKLIMIFKK